jgi:hypothetical protein
MDDDDILSEILLRLPPLPFSLPRASLVCKRWHRLVSDPHFLRCFRGRHAKPPLLGFFSHDIHGRQVEFTSALDPPDRVPTTRFSLPLSRFSTVLGCRHGRVLAIDWSELLLLIWDPASGDKLHVAIPPDFGVPVFNNGAIVCAGDGEDHVHGDCCSKPFQVIMVGTSWLSLSVCIYSSATGEWGNLSHTPLNTSVCTFFYRNEICHSTMVGSCIYWLLFKDVGLYILKFDLALQCIATIEVPPGAYQLREVIDGKCQLLITPADGGELGFLVFSRSDLLAQLWNSNGVTGWVLKKTIKVSNLLSLTPNVDMAAPKIIGFSEGDNAILLRTYDGVFIVYLNSLAFKKLSERMDDHLYHSFASFYTTGKENLCTLQLL